jgi:hypothetical protein
MFTVANDSPSTPQMYSLPDGVSGPVRIEVQDAEQINGEAVDSVSVDFIRIMSYTEAGDPPAAPSALSILDVAATSVSLAFTDNADDEFGFELRRSNGNPAGNCDAGAMIASLGAHPGTGVVTHTDDTADPGTTYWYWVKAFNGAGDGGNCSNAVSATTGAAPAITLAVNGSKHRGVMLIDLSWSDATSASLDIWRNGSLLITVANDGSHQDDTGQKGSASWTYQVCHAGTTVCSNEATATF